jgi:hypothetical protein
MTMHIFSSAKNDSQLSRPTEDVDRWIIPEHDHSCTARESQEQFGTSEMRGRPAGMFRGWFKGKTHVRRRPGRWKAGWVDTRASTRRFVVLFLCPLAEARRERGDEHT